MAEIKRFFKKQLGKEDSFRRSRFGAIVLVTDFGDDLAASECRLSLDRVFQENRIVPPDLITVNDVAPFNKVHAAFNLCRLSSVAPANTIFIGVIDPGVGTERKSVIVKTAKEHYFIGPDNGIFFPAANHEKITDIWQIDKTKFTDSSITFHGRDIFSPIAAKIACGLNTSALGVNVNSLVELYFQSGQILHIDFYGNLKVNQEIPIETSGLILQDKLTIPLVKTFEDVNMGQPLAYLGSSGLLEIAVREGNAAKFFGYKIGDCLNIRPII
jgi:hypothetical protein